MRRETASELAEQTQNCQKGILRCREPPARAPGLAMPGQAPRFWGMPRTTPMRAGPRTCAFALSTDVRCRVFPPWLALQLGDAAGCVHCACYSSTGVRRPLQIATDNTRTSVLDMPMQSSLLSHSAMINPPCSCAQDRSHHSHLCLIHLLWMHRMRRLHQPRKRSV